MAAAYRKLSKATRRRGTVLIVILVCFAIAAAMFVMLGRQSLAQRRDAETQIWAAQAQWIVEAALERAAARLSADPSYTGETWAISAAEMGGNDGAKAVIHVEKLAGWPNVRTVRVEADYPDDPVHRSRWTKCITVAAKPTAAATSAKEPQEKSPSVEKKP
jgi:Tfp pilus assembly protein PilX